MTTNILSKKRKLEDFTTVTAPKGKKYFKYNKESDSDFEDYVSSSIVVLKPKQTGGVYKKYKRKWDD